MAGDGSSDEPPTTTILLNGYDLNSYLFTHRLAQHSDLGGEVSLCGEWKSMYKLATGNKGQWSAQQQMGHLCQALPSQAQEPLQREGRQSVSARCQEFLECLLDKTLRNSQQLLLSMYDQASQYASMLTEELLIDNGFWKRKS